MFCPKCGKEIPDGATVCEACGAALEVPEKAEEIAAETPTIVEEIAAETPTIAEESAPVSEVPVDTDEDTSSFTEPSFEKPAKNKKKKGLIVGIASGVVALAAVLLVVFNFSLIKGYFIKFFGSDEDYFRYVEYKAFSEGTDELTAFYGKFTEAFDTKGSVDGNISVQVSDEVMGLLEKAQELILIGLKISIST